MKVPLRFQSTEYDCGTTTFINALAYLFEREEIPVTLLKEIHQYTLDAEGKTGVIGEGGTSHEAVKKLVECITEYEKKNILPVKCQLLRGKEVTLEKMEECIKNHGVIIIRCYLEVEHYALITNIKNGKAYIFDPYYLEENYYETEDDKEVKIVIDHQFAYNRIIKEERLFEENKKDFSLLSGERREAVLVKRKRE